MKLSFSLIIFLFVALISCQTSTSDNGGTQKEFITDAPPEIVDSVETPETLILQDSTKTELKKYFSEDLIKKIENYFDEYNTVNSDTAFQKIYDSGVELCKELA